MTVSTSSEVERFVGTRPCSQAAYERAQRVLPGGVAQQMRAMRPFPITIARASGARKWDVDGHEYIDYHFGSGALLLGHAHPEVTAAIEGQLRRGWHFAEPHELEAEWGEWVQRLVSSMEQVRFV